MLKTINLLGVSITNETESKVSEYVLDKVRNSSKKFFVTTPNPEILVYASSHPAYREVLNKAEVALPDGVGVLLGARLTGKPVNPDSIGVKNRITGTDFIETLCRDTKDMPVSMGFLGGRGGVAELASKRLQENYPWIDIAFVGEEWNDEGFARGPVELLSRPTSSHSLRALDGSPSPLATPRKIDILFVAFGFPKQEEWIAENLDKLPVKMAMGVGGAFDYISGGVMRAPKLLRALGLEWLFRLFIQPWRFRRQLALLKFISLVLKEKK